MGKIYKLTIFLKYQLKVTLLTYQPFVCRPQHKQTAVALLQKVHPRYDPALSLDLKTNLMTVSMETSNLSYNINTSVQNTLQQE